MAATAIQAQEPIAIAKQGHFSVYYSTFEKSELGRIKKLLW